MKVSEVQLKAMFAEIAEKHEQINSFFWGDIIRATRDREVEQYPLLSVYIAGTGGNFNARLVGTPLVVTVVDRVNKDDSTLDDTSSDTERVVKQIYNILERSKRWQRLLTVRSTTNVRLYEAQSDWLAGHTCTITVDRKDSRSVCDIPIVDYDFDSDFSPICSPVTVQNSSENYSVEVDSGSTLTLPDTTVEVNGDDKGDVPSIDTLNVKLSDSGGTVTPDSVSIVGSDVDISLSDITYNVYVDGNLQQTVDLPYSQNNVINITG